MPALDTPHTIHNNANGGPFVDVYIHTFISPLNRNNANRTNIESEINSTMRNLIERRGGNRPSTNNPQTNINTETNNVNNIQRQTEESKPKEDDIEIEDENSLLGRKRDADESIVDSEANRRNNSRSSSHDVYDVVIEEINEDEGNVSHTDSD